MIGRPERVPRRGEIWLAFTPGQPDDPHQPRPVLVVSDDRRNVARDSAIVVPVFSRGRLGPVRVVLPRGTAGIPHDSVLFCDEIVTLDYRFFESGPIGPVAPQPLLVEVVRAVRRAIGEVVADPG